MCVGFYEAFVNCACDSSRCRSSAGPVVNTVNIWDFLIYGQYAREKYSIGTTQKTPSEDFWLRFRFVLLKICSAWFFDKLK